MTQFAFGHAIRLNYEGKNEFRFQNFFIGDKITRDGADYLFAAFGFSGVTVNRSGDGLEATLVFPNNDLTRSWAIDAIESLWVVEVKVLIIDTDATEPTALTDHQTVHTYIGQVTSGQWDNVSLNLELSTVLDAVGTDVPRRSLNKSNVGNLPISNSVRLR